MSRIGSHIGGPSFKQSDAVARREPIGGNGRGRSTMKADFEKAAVAAGVDPTKLKEIEAKIQAQLRNAQTNPGSGFSLPGAIDAALKESGADLDKFHTMMQQLRDQRHPGRPEAATTQATPRKAGAERAVTGKLDIQA